MQRIIFSSLAICFVFLSQHSWAIDAKHCVHQAMHDLAIPTNIYSDPVIIDDILTRVMYLGDVPEIRKLLGSMLREPQPMAPMIEAVRSAIISKQPAVAEFLCKAHDAEFLKPVDSTRILHHMLILEAINSAMIKDWRLMEVVHKAFLAKRAEHNISEETFRAFFDILLAGAGFFGSAKSITMDGTMRMYAAMRERGEITLEEVKKRIKGLFINISEAQLTDLAHGYLKNAAVAAVLNSIQPRSIDLVGPMRLVKYRLDSSWTSLYESWNFAFIIGNLDNMHVLLPKLLIPSVIGAESDDYVFNRALALWTSLNFVLLAKVEKKEDVVLPKAREIAKLWGEVNARYAASLSYDNLMSRVLGI